LDNFITGKRENIEHIIGNPRFKLIEGDIRDFETYLKACAGIDIILHQDAVDSIPRSIEDPITTHQCNANGFVNML
jgi:UDP-N-acetylglucosamine 4-epimerase